jgi:hypothetical protein
MPKIEFKALWSEEAVRLFRGNGFAVSINRRCRSQPA